jgi:hypothetical protein
MLAWSRGELDARKVRIICDGLADASPLGLEALASGAVDSANSHTGPELRRWLQRRVIAADPDAAEARRRRALADRKITVTPLANGLSELTALLPSVQARTIYETVNAVAHSFDHADPRTMDQKRSDAFVDLVIGRAEPPRVNLNVVVPIESMVGASQNPATLQGVGPITTSQGRRQGWPSVELGATTPRRTLITLDVPEPRPAPHSAGSFLKAGTVPVPRLLAARHLQALRY